MNFLSKLFGPKDPESEKESPSSHPTEEITEAQKAAIEKLLEDLRNEDNIEGRIKASEELGKLTNFGDKDVVSALAAAAKNAALKSEVGRMTLAHMQGCRPDQIVFRPHADHSRVTNAAINSLVKLSSRKGEIGKRSKDAVDDVRRSIKAGISHLTGYGSS